MWDDDPYDDPMAGRIAIIVFLVLAVACCVGLAIAPMVEKPVPAKESKP